ncbi:hypothetical protein NPIL_87771 [Nephila pilipes]|uniref:Cation-transporting P-type ATPase C-terminal domain-containing protein n=1 Tax=Nephila pilipes TaxID=299642 RepID=A0A8X6TS34_NEPPI|nr:hypothetical protein NPIL_87771 [Nephila pilipes]
MYLSGDHPICAKAIARTVGIIGEHSETRDELAERLRISIEEVDPGSVKAVVIYGDELDGLKDAELAELLARYEEVVFSRIIPFQKLRIVKACQQLLHTVAITGRKYEDHESLKQADIGIALANSSCDVCCDNADIILLDKSLLTFVTALKEGRRVFDNLRKSIAYVLTCKITMIVPFFLLLVMDIPLPLGVTFIILIFLGSDMISAYSLIFEKSDRDIMHRSPKLMKEKNVIDFKFIHRLLHKSCCCLGLMASTAGVYTYFIIMAENGFMPHDLHGIRKAWYSKAVNDLKDRYNQEWTYSARKELEYCSQTGFFVTVVVVQLFCLIGHKTSMESLLTHGMRNYVMNFSLLFSIILAVIYCNTPVIRFALHTYPMK